ncbi:MAG: DUF6636 domain-containing protein [Hyphomicrobiaceae bacterium]
MKQNWRLWRSFRVGSWLIGGLLAAALAGHVLPDAAAADRDIHRVQHTSAPGMKGFRTPSDNIHCMIDDYGVADRSYPPFLRCDIQRVEGPMPAKPSSCAADWGTTFAITVDGAAGTLICAGDTIRNERWPILPYGSIWQQDGFTCRSETTGVTCVNGANHGFTLSRRARTVF